MEAIIEFLLQAPLTILYVISGIIFLIFLVILFHKKWGIKSIGLKGITFESAETKKELEQSKKEIKRLQSISNAQPELVETPGLPGRYFIGIDIGREKIDYCLIDYERFLDKDYRSANIIMGGRSTPHHFRNIYKELVDIVRMVSQEAEAKDVKSIDGIGLGLPGQVNPKQGILVKSPGFETVANEPLVQEFANHMRQELKGCVAHPQILSSKFPIEIDNDVRCATRYVWKRHLYKDAICVFVGIGLGSGIVLGGKMLYGCNFTAGEIGHTVISDSCKFMEGQTCNCGLKGYHWEMYVSSNGMMRIAKTLDPKEYKRLKKDYDAIIKGKEFKRLLKEKMFSANSGKHFDDKNELTTYFFSLSFYAGEEYASNVVKEFIEYLAIGIANYINIINPQVVYLGGGMIRGFYDDKYTSPYLGHTTAVSLGNEIKKYALASAANIAIVKRDYDETKIASIGAALMLKERSYFDYKEAI